MTIYVVVKPDNEVLGAFYDSERAIKLAVTEYRKLYGDESTAAFAEDWVTPTELK